MPFRPRVLRERSFVKEQQEPLRLFACFGLFLDAYVPRRVACVFTAGICWEEEPPLGRSICGAQKSHRYRHKLKRSERFMIAFKVAVSRRAS